MFNKTTKSITVGTSTLKYTLIPWDSKYLENSTIEITDFSFSTQSALHSLLKKLQEIEKLKKGDLLFYKIPPQNISLLHSLYEAGFYWIEQSLTLSIDLEQWTSEKIILPNKDVYTLVQATGSDKKVIQSIAKRTFTADRYHLDPNILKEKADYRYEMWIENSFLSKDKVFKFLDINTNIVGFFIINDQEEVVELRLAGLNPDHIGHGLGKTLYYSMYKYLKDMKHSKVQAVISFNNLPVLNVYLFLGNVKCTEPFHVLHKVV